MSSKAVGTSSPQLQCQQATPQELDPLCDYCTSIPLDPEVLKGLPEHDTSWSLGTGRRVKESTCPLCKLVESIFFDDQKFGGCDWTTRSLAETPDVVLDWYNDIGPGRRGAFTIESVEQHYICFGSTTAASDAGGGDCTEDAFYLRASLPAEVYLDRISSWLTTCAETHGSQCWPSESLPFDRVFQGLKVIRFIDVIDECLVQVNNIHPYVALSYVWGSVQNFRLTKINKRALSQKGAFRAIHQKLPRTVQDAMTLVRALGLRYLWVDALCLLQNDPEDLDIGINVMDKIYERSYFTIVAACGHDANAGLPGVREESRRPASLATQIKPGVALGVVADWDLLFDSSVYSTRAWTLQEFLLSKRTLCFTNDRVFFHCQVAAHSEACLDHPCPTRIDSNTSGQLIHSVPMALPLEDFATILQHYTQRALSDQNDVLRAMAGIIRRFSDKLEYPFFQGLPTGALDIFLLFRANRTILHRRPNFPSYSWAGWTGAIMVDGIVESPDLNEWLAQKSWVVWYQRHQTGEPHLLSRASCQVPTGTLVSLPEGSPNQDGTGDLRLASQPSRFSSKAPAGLQLPGFLGTKPTQNFDFHLPNRPYPFLQFWTLAVFFHIDDTTMDVFLASSDIIRDEGVSCGRVWMDGFEEMTFFESTGPFEFILLSERGFMGYNVMMLEWVNGVAERRGIGYIYKPSLSRSCAPGPVWKEILLA